MDNLLKAHSWSKGTAEPAAAVQLARAPSPGREPLAAGRGRDRGAVARKRREPGIIPQVARDAHDTPRARCRPAIGAGTIGQPGKTASRRCRERIEEPPAGS